jgi:hypothetical protein
MSVEYQIDSAQGVVFVRCSGVVTVAEMWDAGQRLRSDPTFEADQRLLIDLHEVTGMDTPSDALHHFAKDGDPFSGKSRRAVVAPQTYAYGVARMYEALREDRDKGEFRVFRTMDEAREWLRLGSGATSA